MQLFHMDFNGVINVGSLAYCSKYDFGVKLAEEFGFEKRLIRVGSIEEHSFKAPRGSKINMDFSRFMDIPIIAPDWKQSLKTFMMEAPFI